MRIVRFQSGRRIRYGVIAGDAVRELRGDPFRALAPTGGVFPLDRVRLLSPCLPSKVVAVGLNYAGHAREVRMAPPPEPILFLKPSSAVIGPGDPIVYPLGVGRLDPEAELAAVIGTAARNVPVSEAGRHIFGFTCLNDVTARDLQARDKQWTRSKSFDTFCPIGPWIETEIDPGNLAVRLRVNGETRQDSTTAGLIFPVAELVSFISSVMTLAPGDVIATGTPSGIAPVGIGDVVEVEIEGIGILRNTVIASR
ncbi:MAG: fumarylacetoacetate hydrolase family protein [Candidatus Aureabacteria bacterium]|nr:fumarylacetoacetate hydrolase family protein [Candidatus Auribacterota bacterium]